MNLRLLGAALLLGGGAIHTRLAHEGYGSDDLVAVFFLNGIASAVVGAATALGRGPLAPVAGTGISVVSLLALALSRTGDGVLQFRGQGLQPAPDVLLVVVFEAAAVAVLGLAALRDRRRLVTALRPR